jgi:hypothetical protein
MASGVEENCETFSRLVTGLSRTNLQYFYFTSNQIINFEIKVLLLRDTSLGPGWCSIILNSGESDRRAAIAFQLCPSNNLGLV